MLKLQLPHTLFWRGSYQVQRLINIVREFEE